MRKRWIPVAQFKIRGMTINAAGIDVSKGKSMVTVMCPFGEVVFSPLEVSHTNKDLTEPTKKLKSLPGETRVIMEYAAITMYRSI